MQLEVQVFQDSVNVLLRSLHRSQAAGDAVKAVGQQIIGSIGCAQFRPKGPDACGRPAS